jgi:hypothetical protein
MLHAALAERERKVISERTIAALAAAKARGQALGNPRLDAARDRQRNIPLAPTPSPTALRLPFARPKLPGRRRFNGRGIGTTRGGKWAPQAVANCFGGSVDGRADTRRTGAANNRARRRRPADDPPTTC